MKYNKNEVTGKMRDRIILQNVTRVRSLTGFASEIWTDTTTIWAFAESKLPGSNETIIEGKNTAKNICDFTIRYISSITEESRVVFKNKIYQVKNIKISHDRRFISFQGVYYDSYSTVIGLQSCSASLLAQSSLSAALMRVIKYQASLNAFGSVSADIALVQKVASSLNAFGTLTGDINFVQKAQASLLTSSSVTGNIIIPKLVQSLLTGTGTTAANLTVQSAASLLLDLYPSAAAAYSLRKLRTAYTGSAIRVRRSSDNTEQDIGFVSDQLDTVSILSFCGAGNGFVTTWYDQSGNARDAIQTVQANQPQIVSSGVVLNLNSKPALKFDGTNDWLFANKSNQSQPFTLFSVANTNVNTGSAGSRQYILDGYQDGGGVALRLIYTLRGNQTNFPSIWASSVFIADNIATSTNQRLYYALYNGSNSNVAQNINSGVTGNPGNNSLTNYTIGANYLQTTDYLSGNVQEFILYNSDKSSNRTDISTNINTHYGIY